MHVFAFCAFRVQKITSSTVSASGLRAFPPRPYKQILKKELALESQNGDPIKTEEILFACDGMYNTNVNLNIVLV
jgi:hypothetical protein